MDVAWALIQIISCLVDFVEIMAASAVILLLVEQFCIIAFLLYLVKRLKHGKG